MNTNTSMVLVKSIRKVMDKLRGTPKIAVFDPVVLGLIGSYLRLNPTKIGCLRAYERESY